MTQTPASKLFIRSEVLAVMNYLGTVEAPSRQDRIKQIKRLQAIEDQETVQKILVKELQRASSGQTLQIVTELLMELADIGTVQQPLWSLIENPKTRDEVKDAANLILRHLGDETDPNLYLEYLDDPAGLISRETERMLEVSLRNPEAQIDFIDFIFSLPVDEQCNLIRSLKEDYPLEYLESLLIPALMAQPPLETQELILLTLADIRSASCAFFLHEYRDWFQQDPGLSKAYKVAVNTLKLAGFYREEAFERFRSQPRQPHPVVEQSKPYECYATIPDGIGNQGIVISRERENGDIAMMSVAINDIHGIMDCFGFYELSKADFQKLTEKFHEESSKVHASPAYCWAKLQQAEKINFQNQFRIPYEYTAWKVLIANTPEAEQPVPDLVQLSLAKANPQWEDASINLYHHPDFSTWFLEEGDHPVVTGILEDVLEICARMMAQSTDKEGRPIEGFPQPELETAFIEALDGLAETLIHALLKTEWRKMLINRLADASYLLNEQKAHTFSTLAATEVRKLEAYRGDETALNGFIKHYGRRCIEEDLLRLKQGAQQGDSFPNREMFEYLVERVLSVWEVQP
jgi:hypothetical protein